MGFYKIDENWNKDYYDKKKYEVNKKNNYKKGNSMIPGLGLIAGSTIGAIERGVSGKKNRENQIELQQNQQQWQEHMASTNYQRTTEDLQKAGLNPVLATNSGTTTMAPQVIDQSPKNHYILKKLIGENINKNKHYNDNY